MDDATLAPLYTVGGASLQKSTFVCQTSMYTIVIISYECRFFYLLITYFFVCQLSTSDPRTYVNRSNNNHCQYCNFKLPSTLYRTTAKMVCYPYHHLFTFQIAYCLNNLFFKNISHVCPVFDLFAR